MAAQPRCPSLLLITLATIAANLCLLHGAAAQQQPQQVPIYPNCPYTKKPPVKSNMTFSRCVGATSYTCCPDCYDVKLALLSVSANGSGILNQISAGLGTVLAGKDIQLCSMFVGNTPCQLHLEQVVCANGCDPESGHFLKLISNNTHGVLSVCSDYSSIVYDACKALPLPGFGIMADFFPTKELFMTKLFGAVIGLIGNLNYTVRVKQGMEKCYNGPRALPAKPVCCDPLRVPKSCPKDTVNFTANPEFKPFVNRQVDPKGCTVNPSLAMLGMGAPPAPSAGGGGSGGKSAGAGFGVGRLLASSYMGYWAGLLVSSWLGVWLVSGLW